MKVYVLLVPGGLAAHTQVEGVYATHDAADLAETKWNRKHPFVIGQPIIAEYTVRGLAKVGSFHPVPS